MESFEEKLRGLKLKCDEAWYAWHDAWEKDKEDPYTQYLKSAGFFIVFLYEVLSGRQKLSPETPLHSPFSLEEPSQF